MRRAFKFCAVALAASISLSLLAAPAARADAFDENNDKFTLRSVMYAVIGLFVDIAWNLSHPPTDRRAPPPGAAPTAAAVDRGATTFKLVNYGAGVQSGEPTQGGAMRKTIWARFPPSAPGRVVVHTFGTAIDTALAAYTGDKLSRLKRVAFNDDAAAPGTGGAQSLIQFDVAKGLPDYQIQIGSPSGEEDDVFLTFNAFPPGGGLSAFFARVYGNTPVQNDVFTCEVPGRCQIATSEPTFILHNSMDKPLTVTASSDLGPGVKAPGPIVLAAGATASATFSFTSAFDATTVRAVSGAFTFTGRAGSEVATIASHPALIVVKAPFDGLEPVKVKVDSQVRAGRVGDVEVFDVELTNDNAEAARDCHARGDLFNEVDVGWQRADLATGDAVAAKNEPFSIAAGKTERMRVAVRMRKAYLADPAFEGLVRVDCANTNEPSLDASNRFGVTARGVLSPADMSTALLAPADGVLQVGGAGAEVRFVTKNFGPTGEVVARPQYVAPFDDGAARQFKATVCRTDPGGECLKRASGTVAFKARKNGLAYFKLLVRAPAGSVPFDPATRRMFLVFDQPRNAFGGTMPVGADSVAVRKK